VVVPVFLLTAVFTLLCHTIIAVPPPHVGLPSSRVILQLPLPLPLPLPAFALLAIPPSTQVTLPFCSLTLSPSGKVTLPLYYHTTLLLSLLPFSLPTQSCSTMKLKSPYLQIELPYFHQPILYTTFCLKLPYLYTFNVVPP
jgi:hypothetical protein